jgi:hypothetical protein
MEVNLSKIYSMELKTLEVRSFKSKVPFSRRLNGHLMLILREKKIISNLKYLVVQRKLMRLSMKNCHQMSWDPRDQIIWNKCKDF